MRFWQAGLAAIGGMMTVSASAAEAGSIMFVGPPKLAVSNSFAVVEQIPSPVKHPARLARSPLDRPPDYRWDAPVITVSASVIAFGTREIETPVSAPIPRPAQRRQIAHAAPATVFRTGIRGGAFPGSATVAASASPAAAATPRNAPKRNPPARQPTAPPAGGPDALPVPGFGASSRFAKPM